MNMPTHSLEPMSSRLLSPFAAVCAANLLAVAGALLFPALAFGQDNTRKNPPQRAAGQQSQEAKLQEQIDNSDTVKSPPDGKTKLHRLLDESAKSYAIYAGDDHSDALELKCVLRWANVTRGSVDGATYIWTQHGRPLATVCVYPWQGLLCDNFQSLAEGPVTAYLNGGKVWQCEKPGVNFQAVPDGPRPDDSASGRQQQLKQLGSQFRATLMGWNAADSDREQLRMLPRPVHRWEENGLVQGAIFAFVQGTDPEVFLLLEVRPKSAVPQSELNWRYALARRTSGWLEVYYKDQLAWKAERLSDYSDPKQPHFQHSRPLPVDQLDAAR
jgi:hypothetical protein